MSRKLRVLLIDDNPAGGLGSPHLELVQVLKDAQLDGSGHEPSLSNWTQHLWLWSNDWFPRPEPDLVLIDCNYTDTSAPVLRNSLVGDPRGLLHGMAYIARTLGRNRTHPLGFAVYSQDATGFADDPYAQFAIGFLLSMAGDREIAARPADETMWETCGAYLKRLHGGHPRTAWKPALEMYRSRVARLVNSNQLFLDPPARDRLAEMSALFCAGDPARRVVGARAFESGIPLVVWSETGKDQVDARSVFADLLGPGECWNSAADSELKTFLGSLNATNDMLDAVEWSLWRVRDFLGESDITPPRITEVIDKGNTRLRHQVALISAWLIDRVIRRSEPRFSATKLAEKCDLAAPQLERGFRGLNTTWSQVVATLDGHLAEELEWPVHLPWVLRVAGKEVARYLKIDFPFSCP